MTSIERLRELLAYDPETGVLRWRVSRGTAEAGSVAGSPRKKGYLRVKVDGKTLLLHRVAWALVHGSWPLGDIDHVNGARHDNRITNLRDVPHYVNLQNRLSAQSNSGVGLLGVSPEGRRFMARIQVNGRKRHLGTFDTAEQAHDAYLAAKRQLHAGNTL